MPVTPVFIPYASSSNRVNTTSIDFFCKTEEHKTEKQIEYCRDFYENRETEDICIFVVTLMIVGFFAWAFWKSCH